MKPRLYVIHSLEVTHMYINNWLTVFKLNWSIESHLIDQTNCLMSVAFVNLNAVLRCENWPVCLKFRLCAD